MEFGVLAYTLGRNSSEPYTSLRSLVRRADTVGFDSVWKTDHLFLPADRIQGYWLEERKHPYNLEAYTSLAAFAEMTDQVTVGTMVTPLSLRHPSSVAKMATTIDHISDGRFALGVGAGWFEPDFAALERELPSAGTRVGRLREGIELLREFFTAEDEVTFSGDHFTVEDIPFWPKPKSDIPIWVGGYGPRTRKIAAELGDGWCPAMMHYDGLEKREYGSQLDEMVRRRQDAGRQTPLTGVAMVSCSVARREADAKEAASTLLQREDFQDFQVSDLVENNIAMVGEPSDIIEMIEEWEAVGVEHIVFQLIPGDRELEMVELIADEVMPAFS